MSKKRPNTAFNAHQEQTSKKTKHFVDVFGLDRKKLLNRLWENATFVDNSSQSPYFEKEALLAAHKNGYVDTVCGKRIKAFVFGNEKNVDCTEYDKLYGSGTFQSVVTEMRTDIEFVDPFLRANVKEKGVCFRLMGKDDLLIELPFQFYTITNWERHQNAHQRKEENNIALPPTIAPLNKAPQIINIVDQRLLDESYFEKDPFFADTLTAPGIYGITAETLFEKLRTGKDRKAMSGLITRSKKYLKQAFPSLFDDEYFANHPFPYKVQNINLVSATSIPFLLLTRPFKEFFKNVEKDLFTSILSWIVEIRTDFDYRTTTVDAKVDHLDYICRQLLVNAKRAHAFILLSQESFVLPDILSENEEIDIEDSGKQLRIKNELGRLNVKIDNYVVRSERRQLELLKRLEDEENMRHLIVEASIKPLTLRIQKLEHILAELLNNASDESTHSDTENKGKQTETTQPET